MTKTSAGLIVLLVSPALLGAQVATSANRIPPPSPSSLETLNVAADADTGRTRVAALSDGFYTRLRIHKIASFVTLPVMAIEYVLGDKLLHDEQNGVRGSGSLTGAHSAVAATLVGLFALNTVTGALNLWEERHIPEGRARRIVHTVLMLAADGGFAYTASLGGGAKLPRNTDGTVSAATLAGVSRHRQAAIFSISTATVGSLMMWLWKD